MSLSSLGFFQKGAEVIKLPQDLPVLNLINVQDNYPGLAITQLELSPFYLQEARKNMNYWRKMRGASAQRATPIAEDRFLHAPAENIPAPDNSYDVVSPFYFAMPCQLPHKIMPDLLKARH